MDRIIILNGGKPFKKPQGKGIVLRKLSMYVILLSFCFFSCSNEKPEKQTYSVDSVSSEEIAISNEKQFSDTVWIKNKEEQFLLKVLTMLPDSAMGTSWKWSIQERKQIVDEGIKRGYLINDSECCHRKKIKSKHNFFISVVDGSWEMSLFKISEGDFIILADERVGDGDGLYAFELNGDNLTSLPISEIIPQTIRLFYKSPLSTSDEEEISFYEERGNESVFLEYSFLQDKIVVSQYLGKDDVQKTHNKVYNGNRLNLNFNERTKRFDVGKIYWEKENDN
jgi:hypothetical protein